MNKINNNKKTIKEKNIEYKNKRRTKINYIITIIVRLLLLFIIIKGIALKQYHELLIAILSFILTFYSRFLERRFELFLPSGFQIIITLFIFATQYLGEIHDFYLKYSWWDSMLHGVSGVVLGYVGFLFVYVLNNRNYKNENEKVKLSPFFVILFAICFAVTIGVLWEIFEFSMDRIFNTNMQKFREINQDGLVDTMKDLIVDFIGAIISAIFGNIYIKQNRDIIFRNYFKSWFKKERKVEKT